VSREVVATAAIVLVVIYISWKNGLQFVTNRRVKQE
jgi:hypothetical protein